MKACQKLLFILMLATLLVLPITTVWAENGGLYDLTWNTIDGGGQTFSAGGSFTLGGTIGQPDAGLLTGGNYTLGGGFWGGGAGGDGMQRLYLPLVVRNH